jgi:hypothetical protein
VPLNLIRLLEGGAVDPLGQGWVMAPILRNCIESEHI